MATARDYYNYVKSLFESGKSKEEVIRKLMWGRDIDPDVFGQTNFIRRDILAVVACALNNDPEGFETWNRVENVVKLLGPIDIRSKLEY